MPFHGGLSPTLRRNCRYVVPATWRRFLFVLLNQNDNQGQNGKDDHEKLIIRHYAHPLFFGESGATAHHVGTFLLTILYQIIGGKAIKKPLGG